MPTQPPLDPLEVLGLAPEQLPRHIAIIMDGNGRWAQQRDLPRIEGHRSASTAVREAVTQCARLGIQALTLYSFSLDNWKRPQDEVAGLMALYAQYLASEREEILENDIQCVQVGRREGLPEPVLRELDKTEELSRGNRGLTLCLALNYGSRAEIADGVRKLAARVERGELRAADITEQHISDSLYTTGLPDPDLVVRTANEMRLSDFLLWQISYAELYVTDVLWPDFRAEHLYDAIQSFAKRQRRFGAVLDAKGSGSPPTPPS